MPHEGTRFSKLVNLCPVRFFLLVSNTGVKEEKRVKMLTPNKLLTRLPILLAQIKTGNNSYKLEKNGIRQILYLLYWHNKITKKVQNILIKSL